MFVYIFKTVKHFFITIVAGRDKRTPHYHKLCRWYRSRSPDHGTSHPRSARRASSLQGAHLSDHEHPRQGTYALRVALRGFLRWGGVCTCGRING